MQDQTEQAVVDRPTPASIRDEARAAFNQRLSYCETCESSFAIFEKQLLLRVAVLGVCLIRLFLIVRWERFVWSRFTEGGKYRLGNAYAERTLKTVYGEVSYGRRYLQSRVGRGFVPLDVELGLSSDRLSPWVMRWVARLASRMSFKASQMV